MVKTRIEGRFVKYVYQILRGQGLLYVAFLLQVCVSKASLWVYVVVWPALTMSIITRSVRLAVFVEAASCVAMLYQDQPLSFWNSWAVSLGWSVHVVSNVLVFLFGLIHFPVLFLLYHVRGDVGFMIYNGRLTPTSIWLIIAMLVQCALWSLVFFGLLHLEYKMRRRFRRHDA